MFYLTTHSTHFIYGYMASDIWLRTILIVRKETHCYHMGYSFRLTARVLLYAPSHRQDCTYHGLCYTSRVKVYDFLQLRNVVPMPWTESLAMPEAVPVSGRVRNLNVCGHVNKDSQVCWTGCLNVFAVK